jgi:hypothetical protein
MIAGVEEPMSWRIRLSPILDNHRITHGLDDAEARMLIEWLVEQAEKMPSKGKQQADVPGLCLRGRAIARFVALWCHQHLACAALQLAATERFAWPLPTEAMEASDLMQKILEWEAAQPGAGRE